MDRRQQRESRLKGGCSQDWLPHNVSSYLLDNTLALFRLALGSDKIEFGLLRYTGLEASAAARFVHIGSAHHDEVVRPAQALRMLGGIAAAHADGERLGDGFGLRQQVRDGGERAAEVVGIEAGDDDLFAAVGEPL